MATNHLAPERRRIIGADAGAAQAEPREEVGNRRYDRSRVRMGAGQEERLQAEPA
jgi:hypothetical protein